MHKHIEFYIIFKTQNLYFEKTVFIVLDVTMLPYTYIDGRLLEFINFAHNYLEIPNSKIEKFHKMTYNTGNFNFPFQFERGGNHKQRNWRKISHRK